jgi:hypothetical protein
MPHPFFGAKDVSYIILKKRWQKKKLFLAKRACTFARQFQFEFERAHEMINII